MNTYTKLPKKNFHIISVLCFLLVLFISIETIMRVKDLQLFEDFLTENKDIIGTAVTENEAYNNYLVFNLSKFLFKSFAPIFLSIHTYFTYKYLKINFLFVIMWIITLLGSLSYIVLDRDFYSVFYYIDIFIYIILIINILSLKKVIDKSVEE